LGPPHISAESRTENRPIGVAVSFLSDGCDQDGLLLMAMYTPFVLPTCVAGLAEVSAAAEFVALVPRFDSRRGAACGDATGDLPPL